MIRVKNEFLTQFDGSSKGPVVVIMGATNRPYDIDSAALRRMPKRIYVPLPEVDTRVRLIKNLLKHEKHSVTPSNIDSIARSLDGYSCCDIEQVAKEAAMIPMREMTDLAGKPRAMTIQDFEKAAGSTNPSVSAEDCQLYTRFEAEFGAQ
jgi:SpoVK/Ycf46/Vps4 family AAA+-type ATPase